jgi:hypothetical protein
MRDDAVTAPAADKSQPDQKQEPDAKARSKPMDLDEPHDDADLDEADKDDGPVYEVWAVNDQADLWGNRADEQLMVGKAYTATRSYAAGMDLDPATIYIELDPVLGALDLFACAKPPDLEDGGRRLELRLVKQPPKRPRPAKRSA